LDLDRYYDQTTTLSLGILIMADIGGMRSEKNVMVEDQTSTSTPPEQEHEHEHGVAIEPEIRYGQQGLRRKLTSRHVQVCYTCTEPLIE
jgi:hypothetical protein